MQAALEHAPLLSHGQPGLGDLTAYFGAFRNDPDGALNAYREYALSFYVHIMRVSTDPDADVEWPGGSCDRWSEIASRRRNQYRRVIDCEGYAFIAQQLLGAAGWSLAGYRIIYLPTRSNPSDFHIVAVMDYPGETSRRIFIGSERVSTNWMSEANAVFPQGSSNARTTSIAPTAAQAIEEMQQQIGSGDSTELAPFRDRRSRVPDHLGD